jgi:small subunit ribosomal protein S9
MIKNQPTAKKSVKKIAKKPATKKVDKPKKDQEFFTGIGRRKTSVASVRLFAAGDKKILINGKDFKEYFPTLEMQEIVTSLLEKIGSLSDYRIDVRVNGGGIHSQSEAVRHGIARSLLVFDANLKSQLRNAGFLTRDSRMRERKKFGLKRARRGPQWRKR